MGMMILAGMLLVGFIGMTVGQLSAPLSATRLPMQWLILLIVFIMLILAFMMVPLDAERITPIFRQAMR